MARGLQNGATCEVTRVASVGAKARPEAKHAASMCLAAVTRMALAGGYTRLASYTLIGERGTSYRATGWHVAAVVPGREWSCASRPRAAAAQPTDKLRWELGPSSAPYDEMAEAYLLAMQGRVDMLGRRAPAPLPLLAWAEDGARRE